MYAASSLSHVKCEVIMAVNNVAGVFWYTTLCAMADGEQPLQRETIPACSNLQKVQISAIQLNCTMFPYRVPTATRKHEIITKNTKVRINTNFLLL
jgi:hypothetical protein